MSEKTIPPDAFEAELARPDPEEQSDESLGGSQASQPIDGAEEERWYRRIGINVPTNAAETFNGMTAFGIFAKQGADLGILLMRRDTTRRRPTDDELVTIVMKLTDVIDLMVEDASPAAKERINDKLKLHAAERRHERFIESLVMEIGKVLGIDPEKARGMSPGELVELAERQKQAAASAGA